MLFWVITKNHQQAETTSFTLFKKNYFFLTINKKNGNAHHQNKK